MSVNKLVSALWKFSVVVMVSWNLSDGNCHTCCESLEKIDVLVFVM